MGLIYRSGARHEWGRTKLRDAVGGNLEAENKKLLFGAVKQSEILARLGVWYEDSAVSLSAPMRRATVSRFRADQTYGGVSADWAVVNG